MSAEGKIDFIVKPSTKHICVWSLPRGSKPKVRVEVENSQIKSNRLFEITCETLGLLQTSRKYFGLFRGIAYPTKKYGLEETIYLPVKVPICIQKWSFDLISEARVVKTDAEAFRLLSLQVILDIELKRLKLTEDEEEAMENLQDKNFFSHKQYVEKARCVEGYDSIVITDVEIVKKVKLVSTIIQKGTVIDIRCNPKKMTLISKTSELSIPWRKIRSFAEISETNTIAFEVFLSGEKAFAWIEIKSYQGTLLLQMTAEFINNIRSVIDKQAFRQPKWVHQPMKNKLTWKLFKEEVFGAKKERKLPTLKKFDGIDEMSSDEDELEINNNTGNVDSNCGSIENHTGNIDRTSGGMENNTGNVDSTVTVNSQHSLSSDVKNESTYYDENPNNIAESSDMLKLLDEAKLVDESSEDGII